MNSEFEDISVKDLNETFKFDCRTKETTRGNNLCFYLEQNIGLYLTPPTR